MSKVFSKAYFFHSEIYCFLFQFPVYYPFLNTVKYLLTSSSTSSYHFYLSLYICFLNVFQMAVPMQDVTNPVIFSVPRIFLSSLNLCNTSFLTRLVQLIFSIFTRSVKMIFSILLQPHLSKFCRCISCLVILISRAYFRDLANIHKQESVEITNKMQPCNRIYYSKIY
jgi:hypothetical protein